MADGAGSRFWAQAGSSSDDESGSESDSSIEQTNQQRAGGKFGSTFQESDSDSEDEKRVVKSQKDRAWDTMLESILRIKNARKTNDWSVIQDEFEEVNRMVDKSKMLVMKNGLPKFYVKMLADVEDHLWATLKDKDLMNSVKPAIGRAINRMKLTIKKHNKNYEEQIADYRAHPEKYEDDEEEEDDDDDDDSDDDDSDSDSDDDKLKTKSSKAKQAKGGDDSDEDSLFDDDDSDASSDDDDDGRGELKGRARWLKKVVAPKSQEEEARDREKKKLRDQKALEKKRARLEDNANKVKGPAWTAEIEEITEEVLDRKIAELVASRGRKNTDPREVLRKLEVLSKASRPLGSRKEIPVLMHLISAMFDAQRVIDDYMDLNQWRTCYRSLLRVVFLLHDNKALTLGVMPNDDDGLLSSQISKDFLKRRDDEPDEEKPDDKTGPIRIVGSLETFLVRLEDEYTKSLQQINPHTQDYVVRLADEAALVELSEMVRTYYLRVKDHRAAAIVSLLHVEHLYYKHDNIAVAVNRAHVFNKTWGKYSDLHPASQGKLAATIVEVRKGVMTVDAVHPGAFLGNPTVTVTPQDPAAKLEELSQFIFKHGDDRSRTRALLCSVYHHALHDRFHRARDMFLISHIQDVIEKADTKTMILYNRALVTLGLCAFRLGFVHKAHDCLAGICSGRVRELLAQGQARWPEKDPEQEKVERRRQMPYHMHINPDLLDCVHLTSAMLLELPHLARGSLNSHQNVISRQFRKYMAGYNRQKFTGPPENTREHVMAATKCMLSGDWQKACDYILKLEVWNLIPGDGGSKVKDMLRVRLQEEALRTYLITYGAHYDSISLSHLCTTFEMEEGPARRVISRMIFNKEIAGGWEHSPSETLVLHKVEPTNLQVLTQQVAEKVAMLVESNERMLDPLVNVYGYKDDQRRPWGGEREPSDRRRGAGYRGNSTPKNVTRFPNAGGGRGGRGGRGGGRGDRRGDGTRDGKSSSWGSRQKGGNTDGNRDKGDRDGQPAQSSRRVGWGNVPTVSTN